MFFSMNIIVIPMLLSAGLMIYALCVKSKAITWLAAALLAVCLMMGYVLWRAAWMAMPL